MKFWVQKKEGKLYPLKVEDQVKMNKLPLDPVLVTYTKVRNPKLHRKYFKFISVVYNNLPEKYEHNWPSKRSFRKAMEMYAGHFEETVTLKGKRHLHPKSIAYDKLDDMEFQDLYSGVKDVVGKHIMPYIDEVENEIVNNFY